jgi:NIPSNAP protein
VISVTSVVHLETLPTRHGGRSIAAQIEYHQGLWVAEISERGGVMNGKTTRARFAGLLSGFTGVFLGVAVAASAGQAAPPGQGRGAAPAPATPPCGPNLADVKNVAKDSRCFELRTYTVREGSGNIDVLHARFREHTNALFRKHGMTIVGFWQPVTKPDQLIYILAYKDAAARDAAWAAFQADPEWVKVRSEMAVNVQVDNVFMSATDYGPVK